MKNFFLRNYKTIVTSLVLMAFLAVPMVTSATIQEQVNINLTNTGLGTTGNLGDKPLIDTIGNIIIVVLGFLAVVFILFIIYAGFLWLLAQGDETKIKKAKAIIIQGIIAVIVIFLAFAITQFVFDVIIGQGISNAT
ncbi:MAG: hypothetical protein WCV92_00745 [Candidatus Buchananbacteria bacterium]